MPISIPRSNEKRSDFIGRCVSDLSKKGEKGAPTEEQIKKAKGGEG